MIYILAVIYLYFGLCVGALMDAIQIRAGKPLQGMSRLMLFLFFVFLWPAFFIKVVRD